MKYTLLALCLFASPAFAGTLSIAPPGGVYPQNEGAQIITLENQGDKPLSLQVRTFAWAQPGDTLTPTKALIASPSMMTIAPGAKRVLRVMRTKPTAGSYRVLVNELPPPITAKGVNVVMTYSLPFVYEDPNASAPVLKGTWAAGKLTLTNTGGKAAKILTVDAGSWKKTAPGWVLSGGSLVIDAPAKPTSLNVQFNAAQFQTLQVK